MAAILTLLTDFGSTDGYAGALEGAIARVSPTLRVVTITHGVPSHDIGAGAYWLGASAPAFPHGTVHCVVVDPGVGTERPLVAARVDHQIVVAPDNGLLHFLWGRGQDRVAVRVDTSGLDRSRISSTFHGRDVIGPLAARLAVGAARFENLGPKIPSPQLMSEFLPQGDSSGTTARVLVVDRFGNIILAVSRTPWYTPMPASVSLGGGRVISQLVRTYGEITDDFAMLWNSADHLEIAGKAVNAADRLHLLPGDLVRVAWATLSEVLPASSRSATS
ncbi:MAG TPA: SAM-dependent chlorinase/fluorinase [Candidatus Dormibacteraeota bacterium]|nr:SAM-dependent chlorinase/fluorinase [Candidatus Dormibacteraeota bacterium]